jgi:hypothetical protein
MLKKKGIMMIINKLKFENAENELISKEQTNFEQNVVIGN